MGLSTSNYSEEILSQHCYHIHLSFGVIALLFLWNLEQVFSDQLAFVTKQAVISTAVFRSSAWIADMPNQSSGCKAKCRILHGCEEADANAKLEFSWHKGQHPLTRWSCIFPVPLTSSIFSSTWGPLINFRKWVKWGHCWKVYQHFQSCKCWWWFALEGSRGTEA